MNQLKPGAAVTGALPYLSIRAVSVYGSIADFKPHCTEVPEPASVDCYSKTSEKMKKTAQKQGLEPRSEVHQAQATKSLQT